MKRVLLLTGLVIAPWIAEANNFSITAVRKAADALAGKAASPGNVSEKTETVVYQVTVTNTTFKPSAALKAKYILFVERQEVGEKPGNEQIDKVKGSADVKELKPREKEIFSTSEIKLRQGGLSGAYYFPDGGRVKAKDNVVGVWIKLFDGSIEVAEYINPTTLSGKHKWSVD
jgi:hypothetical protein